jgi:alkylation response protein AidB-like acyl-CoA dehydrogenase
MPMAITLTDEQQALREAVLDFAKRECGTREQRDALTDKGAHTHSPEIYERLAELGWLGLAIPEQYGGIGGNAVDLCLFLEDIAYGMIPASGFVISSITAGPYEKFGTEELKREVLTGVVDGNVAAIAMSEPESGSDVGSLTTRADESDGGYVLNGQKTWISEAHVATTVLIVARTTRSNDKHAGLTMFSVPTSTSGVEIRGIPTMGGRLVNDVFLTDCYVPAERVVGEVDNAWGQLMAGLNNERLIIAAEALGQARRSFDDVLAYVKERKQFGRPIGSFQTIKHRLADLATEIECARLLIYDVASKVAANPTLMRPREASMAKLKATEVAKRVALEGMQMMGGYGYATEYDQERWVRRTLVGTIVGGTSEIQREIVASTLGLS